MRTLTIIMLALIAVGLISCSSANVIEMGMTDTHQSAKLPAGEPDRWIWGFWTFSIPPDHSGVSVTPSRNTNNHYNIKILLEQNPCDNCIWTSNFKNNGDETISIDVSIRHPYPFNDYFTGFDVRGIFYSLAHCSFDDINKVDPECIAAVPTGDPQLLNPDDYTYSYSPFREQELDDPPLFRYVPGGDLGATLDYSDKGWQEAPSLYPFIYFYSSEVRNHFAVNSIVTRTYHIGLPPGPWEFGYAVDACWAVPTNVPVTNIETDFPWNANTLMSYKIESFISGSLKGETPSTLTMRVYNHFPELLQFYDWCGVGSGQINGKQGGANNPHIVDNEYVEFTYELKNELGRPPGVYPVEIHSSFNHAGDDYLDHDKGFWWDNWGNHADVESILWVTVES